MNPERLSASRISDAVAELLENRILEGSLKPGDRLAAERALAAQMGVSRPSLRTAIQQLASKGMLVTRHGGGTYVTDRLEAHFADPWQQMLQGHPMLQQDLLEFRQMLESQAAFLAAERATDADIERIDRAHASLAAEYEGGEMGACVDHDVAFHQAISEASHNVLISHLTASLMRIIHGHITSNLEHLHARRQRWDELKAQHRSIWLAIRERRPEQAAAAARTHIEFVRKGMAEAAIEDERRKTALRRLSDASP